MKRSQTGKRGERGVALVVVLFSLVIMSVIGLSLAYTAGNEVRGSHNELLAAQAYYAAEAGAQEALNVMRGHRCPIGASDCSAALGSNKINFQIASTPATSNASGDDSTVTFARLSRWLSYNSTDADGVVALDSYADGTPRLSYRVRLNSVPGSSDLELVSTGFAPLGARRTVRLRVSSPGALVPPLPALITFLGQNPTGTAGNSNAHVLSGKDQATSPPNPANEKPILASVGSANVTNLLNNSFGSDKPGTFDTALPALAADLSAANSAMHVTGQIPFNNSPAQARAFIAAMTSAAHTVVPAGGSLPSGALGSASSPKIVVVNGDLSLSATSGAGILIVTGTLTLSGNCSYDGLIFALGTGRIERNGGGNGVINGGILLAAFGPTSTTFDGSPAFATNGGGNSDILYNSLAASAAVNALPAVSVKSFTTDSTSP
jgi:Tfp pilus assembly protein PilX